MLYCVECYMGDIGQKFLLGTYPTFKRALEALEMYSGKQSEEWHKRNKLNIAKIKIDIKVV